MSLSINAPTSVADLRAVPPSSSSPASGDAPETEQGAAVNAAAAARSAVIIRCDEATGRFVYEFRDPATDELLCQFPSEALIALAAEIRERGTAAPLIDQRV